MDSNTVSRILHLLAPHVDEQTLTHFTNICRKEYLMDSIDLREKYITTYPHVAKIADQYKVELPLLYAKLQTLG
jgi:hypothetical protein